MKPSYTERGIVLEHEEIHIADATLQAFGPESARPLIDVAQVITDDQKHERLTISEETALLLADALQREAVSLRAEAVLSRHLAVIATRGSLLMFGERMRLAKAHRSEADALHDPLADRRLAMAERVRGELRHSIQHARFLDAEAPTIQQSA